MSLPATTSNRVNPLIPLLSNPIGLDKAIQDIQIALSDISWLEKIFGRAFEFNAINTLGKRIKKPMVYIGNGEYYSVLPNDTFKSMCFFLTRGHEESEGYLTGNTLIYKVRGISIIFWVNLKLIDPTNDYIFTEKLKTDVEKVLIHLPQVQDLENYNDQDADQIFASSGKAKLGVSTPFNLADTPDAYLMYPYSAFRMELSLKYTDILC